mgnify:CR=1 FL=1
MSESSAGAATRALVDGRVDAKTPEDDRTAIAAQLQDLIKKKRELLEKLARSYGEYRGELSRLDAEEKKFAAGANREQIATCSELGLSLEEFTAICVASMQGISTDLGL